MTDLFGRWDWVVLEHPLYLLRMSLYNYGFFSESEGIFVWHCLRMRDEIVSAVENGITVYKEGTLPMVSDVFYKSYNVSAVWQETVFKFCK